MKIVAFRKGHASMWRYRKKMPALGFSYDIEKKEYAGEFEEGSRQYKKALRFCRWHGLKTELGSFGIRSTDYRRKFFAANPPAFGKYYFCSYCGMPVTKKEVQVDHLYPVDKVKSSAVLQERLRRKGASSVNSLINLVPACKRCNQKKSAHMGFWILLGQIGRHQRLWFIRWPVRLAIIITVIVILCNAG